MSFPDPSRRRRICYIWSALWGFWILTPIRFAAYSLHVNIMWHRAISNYCRTWEQWMHCHTQMMHCHDNYMTCYILCAPKNDRCIPDPFPPCGQDLGMRLSQLLLRVRCIAMLKRYVVWHARYYVSNILNTMYLVDPKKRLMCIRPFPSSGNHHVRLTTMLNWLLPFLSEIVKTCQNSSVSSSHPLFRPCP